MDQTFLTVTEFAGLFRRSPQTIRAWCQQGLIEHRRVGRDLLIPAAEATRVQADGLSAATDERTNKSESLGR